MTSGPSILVRSHQALGHTVSLLPHGRSHRLLAVPRPLLPLSAAAGHRLPTSRCGAHLLGPTAAGDHPGAGARGHAQQSARQRGRRCQAGPVHQPCCQPDGRATPEQPHGLLQLWPPAPVQAAERRQRRGPQVSLPELGLLEPLSVACGVQEGCLPGLGLFHFFKRRWFGVNLRPVLRKKPHLLPCPHSFGCFHPLASPRSVPPIATL